VSNVNDSAPTAEAELRARYRAERAKRLRPDGNDQYVEPTGKFAHFVEDPYVTRVEREPRTGNVEVAVIGAGFAGITTAARLREAGVSGFCLIDGAGDVGGAWYWNRYPGAMCDTAAMVYLPLLEETGHQPSAKYTMAPEIFGHAQRIATHFGLYERTLFSTEVTALRFDESDSRWVVTTNRGDQLRARFVATGTGPLNRPKLPGIPGLEKFDGHCFHTSRWDYHYTGGDDTGRQMDHLGDKRVGIIGTGATAVQCIPKLGQAAGELFVFQRTPSSIDVRNNQLIDPEWFATLKPGWQREWLMNFCILQTGGFADEDLVKDGWTDISKRIRDRVVQTLGERPEAGLDPELMRRAYEESDDDKMNEIRARVEAVVTDKHTAVALQPWYRQLCKRPCFHDEYLDTYNLPNVHLVHTDGQGVSEIDATGVWVKDRHYDVDCLIFASGFEVGTSYERRFGYETYGRGGVALSDYWGDGMRSLHGVHVHQFPNLFILGIAQGANLLSNVTHNLTEAALSVAAVVSHANQVGAAQVEVTEEAETAWVEQLGAGRSTFLADPDCTPGYYNNEGQPLSAAQTRSMAGYPEGPAAFFTYIDDWRRAGTFEGLAFLAPGPSPRTET
jgi:cation diffusion facilitator CzcD-associated flavoprotein CzcO